MNDPDKVPEVVVYDLLASSGFALSGEEPSDTGQTWQHNDSGELVINIPSSEDGFLGRSVYDEIERIIAKHGL